MKILSVLASAALGSVFVEAKSLKSPLKTLSLPLHRHSVSLQSYDEATKSEPLQINGIDSLVYTVDVQLGGQRFNLTLDTSGFAWHPYLFAKPFVVTDQSCGKAVATQRNFFNPALSKTFEVYLDDSNDNLDPYPYVGLECQQNVGLGAELKGSWGVDTLALDFLTLKNVKFSLSNSSKFPLNPRWPSDGVFPLEFDFGDALEKILTAVGGKREVSLFLNNAKFNAGGPFSGGQITFGGKDAQNCKDNWVTVEAFSTIDWLTYLGSVKIGSGGICKQCGWVGQISTATPLLAAPKDDLRLMVKAFGGQFNDDIGLYTVDCSKVDSLKPISITLGLGFTYSYDVQPKDFVARITTKSGTQCALLLAQNTYGYLVGSQFLPKRCVHNDYENRKIGFADLIN